MNKREALFSCKVLLYYKQTSKDSSQGNCGVGEVPLYSVSEGCCLPLPQGLNLDPLLGQNPTLS